jgi:hypothetical protein
MDYSVFFCLVLILALFACMTADIILDLEVIWSNAGQVQLPETEVNIIELAKEQMIPKLPIPGSDLWANLDAQFEQSKCKELDYNSLTVRELKGIAKQRAIPKYGSMRKSELIAALQSQ